MWNNTSDESQHEIIEDDSSSHSSTPSDEHSSQFSGHVDRHGNPNPTYVSSSNHDTKDGNTDNNDDDDRSYESILTQQRRRNQRRFNSCIDALSDLSFFFGSFMYLWLALSEGNEVLIANDSGGNTTLPDSVDVNGTSQFSFDHGTTAGGHHSTTKATGWYLQDKIVFGNVTLYMMYGLTASILMVAAGFLRLYTARTPSDRVPYTFMVFASSLAVISSALVSSNTFWSNACFSVAIHWFALQAATLLLWRYTSSSPTKRKAYLRLSGDALFLLATLGGIALSYLYIFDATHVIAFSHEYLVISVAGVWFSASFMYLLQAVVVLIRQRSTDEDDCESSNSGSDNNNNNDEDEDKLPKSLPQEDTESTSQANSDEELNDYRVKSTTQMSDESGDDRDDFKTDQTNDRYSVHNDDEEKSVFTTWTDGPGPSDNEIRTKCSLDVIFGVGWK